VLQATFFCYISLPASRENTPGGALAGGVGSGFYVQLHQESSQDFDLLTLNPAREMARVIDKMGEALVEDSI
jgi:hypothetical protein